MSALYDLLCCFRHRSSTSSKPNPDETDPLLSHGRPNGHSISDIPVEDEVPPQVNQDTLGETLDMIVNISTSKMVDVRAARPFSPSSPEASVSRSTRPRSRQPSPTPSMHISGSSYGLVNGGRGLLHTTSAPRESSASSRGTGGYGAVRRGRSRSRAQLGRFGTGADGDAEDASDNVVESETAYVVEALPSSPPDVPINVQSPDAAPIPVTQNAISDGASRSRRPFVLHNTAQIARSWGD